MERRLRSPEENGQTTAQPGGEWRDDCAARRRMDRRLRSPEENGETTAQPGGEWRDDCAARRRTDKAQTGGSWRKSEQPGPQQNGQDGTHVASALPLRRLLRLRYAIGCLRVPRAGRRRRLKFRRMVFALRCDEETCIGGVLAGIKQQH